MANTQITPVLVADMALDYMDNELQLARRVNRQYEGDFKARDSGGVLTVRKPPKFTVQDGPVLTQTQSINQGSITVNIDKWKSVGIDLTGWDRSLSSAALKDFGDTVIKPIASALANNIELSILARYYDIANWCGTAADPPDSYADVAEIRKLLTYNACPDSDRTLALTPKAYADLSSSLPTQFNPQAVIGKAFTEGLVPRIAGFDVIESVHCPTHTVGAYAGSGHVTGASQVGSNLNTHNWTSGYGVFKKGDTFTIAAVYMINPVTKESTGELQTFVVTADCTDSSSGATTIPIYPAIITSGANQTVSGSPADSAALTLKGTASTAYGQNIAFHRNAFGLIMVPPKAPDGLQATTRNYKGYSIAICHGPDIRTYEEIWRADILFGTVTFWPELAVRVTN